MITGIGIDMIEVDRVAEKIGKEKGFRELVFSANEIAYCETKTNKYEHYAARFAAKEAFLKALGTGWANGIAFNEIEVYHDTNGKPLLQLLGNTALQAAAINISQIAVSLTHVKSIASAIIIIEG